MRDEYTRQMIRRGVLRSYDLGRTLSADSAGPDLGSQEDPAGMPRLRPWLNDVWMRRHTCETPVP